MFISRITLEDPHRARATLWDNGGWEAEAHDLMWSFFGDKPSRTRDFIYRKEPGLRFVTVSERKPEGAGHGWTIDTKPYEPRLTEGQLLRFALRANPTISRSTPDRERGKRHDVVQDARQQLLAAGTPQDALPSRYELAQDACRGWLQKKGKAHGFEVPDGAFVAEGYRTLTFTKRTGRRVKLAATDLTGIVQVTNPDQFVDALHHGIGTAKAYGFGLMLVQRA